VAGSLCGGDIGSMLSTTVAYERRMNATLRRMESEGEFIEQCLDLKDLPTVPPYWRGMRKLNTRGPPLLGALSNPPALPPGDFEALSRREDICLPDCRSPEAYSAHVPGAFHVGVGSAFPTWTGTVLPEGAKTVLVIEQPSDLWAIKWRLLRTAMTCPWAGWPAA
jgi:hydroxyacylglutathione hydrolase